MSINKINADSRILECARHKYRQVLGLMVVYNQIGGKK